MGNRTARKPGKFANAEMTESLLGNHGLLYRKA
jgi:hypothetical protein